MTLAPEAPIRLPATPQLARTRPAPSLASAVTVPARPGESPADLRERLLRAADRLQLMLAAGGHVPARWMLRLERPGGASAMPLPASAFAGSPESFARRLPDAALRDVDRLVLNVTPRAHTGATHPAVA